MTNAITKAIARSISHTEAVHITCSAEDLAALVDASDDYSTTNAGGVDAWGFDEDGDEWRIIATLDLAEFAEKWIANWSDGRLAEGFAAWAISAAEETLEALADDDDDTIAFDLAIDLHEAARETHARPYRDELEEIAQDIVRKHRAEFIAALNADLAELVR